MASERQQQQEDVASTAAVAEAKKALQTAENNIKKLQKEMEHLKTQLSLTEERLVDEKNFRNESNTEVNFLWNTPQTTLINHFQ